MCTAGALACPCWSASGGRGVGRSRARRHRRRVRPAACRRARRVVAASVRRLLVKVCRRLGVAARVASSHATLVPLRCRPVGARGGRLLVEVGCHLRVVVCGCTAAAAAARPRRRVLRGVAAVHFIPPVCIVRRGSGGGAAALHVVRWHLVDATSCLRRAALHLVAAVVTIRCDVAIGALTLLILFRMTVVVAGAAVGQL